VPALPHLAPVPALLLTTAAVPPSVINPPAGGFSGPAGAVLGRTAANPPLTRPIPARPGPPGQPGDHTTTGHARDAGSGSAPAMGTVSSSWRPEVVAAGFTAPTDLTVHGRTVRYSGPPS
jgi:hypothetical protein